MDPQRHHQLDRGLAWEEFQLLQGIINRQMEIRWKIRMWLLTVQGALLFAVGSNKLGSNWYLGAAIAATCLSWYIEMSENFVIAKSVKRQDDIEGMLSGNAQDSFPSPQICTSLKETEEGGPTLRYVRK